ncbi:MAG: YggS family pyridoxal phosphate-dependent enzyme [Ignavibacteria bacterium]
MESINIINEKIKLCCQKAGRNPSEVKIIAVSKNTGLDLINQAISAGMKDFGESKARELSEKTDVINADIKWHFLGHLQRNKVKTVVEIAEYIHSVDSVRLAEEINRQAFAINKIQKILLEIKTSSEVAKYGITSETELIEIAEYCKSADSIELEGLMTMAPYTDDIKIIRRSFSDLRNLKTLLNLRGFDIKELSMGMTGDYETAIEEGSTMLRLGSAIFGKRDYSRSWREQ